MLTELKLSNFRIFDDEVKVRFRPITVFIGRNSSGKSSIIKFLLMLQQSLDPAMSQFLTAEGNKVNLGAFPALKNTLTKKTSLRFELATKSEIIWPERTLSGYLNLPDGFDNDKLVYKGSAVVSYSRKTSIGQATYSLVDGTSGKNLLKLVSKILDDSNFGYYASAAEIELFRELDDIEESEMSEDQIADFLNQREMPLMRFVAVSQMIGTLRYQIDSLRHLSPVRNESQRVIAVSSPPVDNVGQMGEYALPHLQKMTTDNQELYEFILPHIRSVVDIDGVGFKTSSGYLTQAFAKNGTTGADVLIADYGFGVSQCLPIFVQGAIMSPYTLMMVEQPEAQLHPTAQLEMGSYFADLWNQRKVGSIIETHSDNILLRLRRLIAKGELSHQDISVAFFTFDEDNDNMPIIKNLDINEDGSMEAGLPMEFFGADVIEGLKLGAGR